jgi:sulfotransferase family protein
VVIVGAARSGSGLLGARLTAGSALAIPPDGGFLAPLERRYGGRRWTPAMAARVVAEVACDPAFRRWGVDPGAVAARVVTARPASLGETVSGFYAAYAEAHGRTRFGDATPHDVFMLDRLDRLWPGMRVVHMLRDGRDVAAAHLDAAAHGVPGLAGSVQAAAAGWRAAVLHARAAGDRLGPRLLTVRYERLVADPRGVLGEVCGFLELPFEPAMLRQLEHVDLPDEPRFWRVGHDLVPGAREWRRELSPGQIAAFEAVAGDELEACGYPCSGLPAGAVGAAAGRVHGAAAMGWMTLRHGPARARRWIAHPIRGGGSRGRVSR